MNWRIVFALLVLAMASAAGAENLTSLCRQPWPFRAEAAIRPGEVTRVAPRAVRGWTRIYHLAPRSRGKVVGGWWPAGATFFGREENGMFIARVYVGMNVSGLSTPGCGNPSGACWPVAKPLATRPVIIRVPVVPTPAPPPVTIEVSVKETKVVTQTVAAAPPLLSFGSGGGQALPAPTIPIGSLAVSRGQVNIALFFGWQKNQRPVAPGQSCPPVTPGIQPTPPAPGSSVIETPNPQAGLGWPGAPVAPHAPPATYPPIHIR